MSRLKSVDLYLCAFAFARFPFGVVLSLQVLAVVDTVVLI